MSSGPVADWRRIHHGAAAVLRTGGHERCTPSMHASPNVGSNGHAADAMNAIEYRPAGRCQGAHPPTEIPATRLKAAASLSELS